MEKFELNVDALGELSDQDFFDLCQSNDHLRLERDAHGKIIMMAPTGSLSGNRNVNISADFVFWNRKHRKGYVFDSSTGFKLPNGATRSPDVSFVLKEKWEALSVEEQEGFAPLCPDFVLELRSKHDSVQDLQAKMEEYLASGATFGWLIDPYEKKIYVYDQQQSTEITEGFHQPLTGRYFMQDFSIVLADVLS